MVRAQNGGMQRKIAKRWLVSGTVQGVGFRYFVQHQAAALGVAGWARNLDDGRVEVYAAGTADRLCDLAAALHRGPQMAHVRGVEEQEDSVQSLSGFQVR
jgi:acylphosphatase